MAANARQPLATSLGTDKWRWMPDRINSQQLSELIALTQSSVHTATPHVAHTLNEQVTKRQHYSSS